MQSSISDISSKIFTK